MMMMMWWAAAGGKGGLGEIVDNCGMNWIRLGTLVWDFGFDFHLDLTIIY